MLDAFGPAVAELLSLGRMGTFASFTKKAVRPVLIATAIVTTPAFIILIIGINDSFGQPDPRDPDAGVGLDVGLVYTFFSAIAGFAISCTIALVWYFIRVARQQREARRIGERFGWTPRTK